MAGLSRKNNKRIIALALTGMFILQQSMCANVFAESTITGITNGGSGAFNINPASTSGNVGFRNYDEFTLGSGDIANFIYNNGIETFVNLMNDKAFTINGVVNTMRDGNFYNGKAVFVSPKGVVVGASGVLNVGSLGIYTPDNSNSKYQALRDNFSAENWAAFENGDNAVQTVDGKVVINGKVFANKDVIIEAADFKLGNETGANSGIFAGIANYALTAETAQTLFDKLVNTDNQKQGSEFSSGQKGEIYIKSAGNGSGSLSDMGLKINGNLVNLGNGKEIETLVNDQKVTEVSGIRLENRYTAGEGINIGSEGKIYNANGLVRVYNYDGSLNVAGNIKNDGYQTEIINSRSLMSLSKNSGLTISGNVTSGKSSTDTLEIQNLGNQGLTISGNVNHTGTADVINGYSDATDKTTGALNVTGKFTTTSDATFTNYASCINGLNVSGEIQTGGKATFLNYGQAGLNINQNGTKTNINSQGLEMNNYGHDGLNIAGKIVNNGTATIYNHTAGEEGLNVNGTIINTGDASFTNSGAAGLNVGGTITSTTLNMTNNAVGGMNFTSGANVTSNGNSNYINNSGGFNAQTGSTLKNTTGSAYYKNTGANGMKFQGTVVNNGTTTAENEAGEMLIGGNFTNTGASTFTNSGTVLNVAGNLTNNAGKLTITNNGSGALNVKSGAVIDAKNQIAMTNNSDAGFIVEGTVKNAGNGTYTNTKGKFNAISGSKMENSGGTATYSNSGSGGMLFEGTVVNQGTTIANNTAGEMKVGGNFTNTGASTFTNSGTTLNVTGNLTNNADKLTITNNGSGALNVKSGAVIDAKNQIAMTNNSDSGFIVEGTVKNAGNGTYTNTKGKFNAISGSKMENTGGTATYSNSGSGGMLFEGTVVNEGTTVANNTAGEMKVGGNFTNKGDSTFTNTGSALNVTGNVINNEGLLTMTNSGAGGLNIQEGATVTTTKGIVLTNNEGGTAGLNISGKVTNSGADATVTNKKGNLQLNGEFDNTGNATFTNDGNTLNVNGTVINKSGKLTMTNSGAGGLNINQGATVDAKNQIKITNTGAGGLNIGGTVKNAGNGEFKNTKGAFNLKNTGRMENSTGEVKYYNEGSEGMLLDGTILNEGTTTAENKAGVLRLGKSFTNKGDSTFTNTGSALNVTGNVVNNEGLLTMTNSGAGGLNILQGATINTEGIALTNNETGTAGLNINGTVENIGIATVENRGKEGLNVGQSGSFTSSESATFTNTGEDGLNVTGKISGGSVKLSNSGKKGLNINANGTNVNITSRGLEMENSGADGLNINGIVNNTGTAIVSNSAGNLSIAENALFNNTGNATFTNNGNAFNVKGTVDNNGNLSMTNNGNGGMNIEGFVRNSSKAGENMYNTGKTTKITNTKGALNVKENGSVTSDHAELTMENSGDGGFNIDGTVTGDNSTVNLKNTNKALNINSKGKVKTIGSSDINITNTGNNGAERDNGINIKGLVNSGRNVNINNSNSNVVIGDNTNNTEYVKAKKNIDIKVTDGSLLNYGVNKVLLVAGQDLNMDVTNGTIGLPVQQAACEGSGCTGIGVKADGSRDFTKSINGKISGKVNAKTTAQSDAAKTQDLVINYAAIDSDMKIDTIKADGRVILTVDDSGHAWGGQETAGKNSGKRYNMINARPNDNTDTNIEGWGISLIANGSIGSKNNKVTFIQNRAQDGYKMDALVNENMYLKENSFNDADYGREKEIKTNDVCTMIAREGDMNVEFAGDTNIKNITAEGDMTVITRGKTLNIENLGHITDESVIPEDYFGPRNQGTLDGGYMKDDYKDEVLPNHVVVKALDINHNIRPTEELVDGAHEAWADSSVTIKNAVIDNGTLDITADNVYANGIEAHFNKNGFSKKENNTTNKTIGVHNPINGASEENDIPTAHAVRPGDVTGISRDENERNYYYNSGDGNMKKPLIIVDDNNDGIADATPLALEKPGNTPPPEKPIIVPEDPNAPDDDGAWVQIQRKIDENDLDNIDKRQFMRFGISDAEFPVLLENNNNGVTKILDISRGGVALAHDGSIKVGDEVPLHMIYGDLDITANIKVVSATTTRAGAEFINLDKATANQLLYLNIILDNLTNELSLK